MDGQEAQNTLQLKLQSVEHVIIIFGKVTPKWVLERLKKTSRIITLEDYPVKLGVFLAAPPKLQEEINFEEKIPYLKVELMEEPSAVLKFLGFPE